MIHINLKPPRGILWKFEYWFSRARTHVAPPSSSDSTPQLLSQCFRITPKLSMGLAPRRRRIERSPSQEAIPTKVFHSISSGVLQLPRKWYVESSSFQPRELSPVWSETAKSVRQQTQDRTSSSKSSNWKTGCRRLVAAWLYAPSRPGILAV